MGVVAASRLALVVLALAAGASGRKHSMSVPPVASLHWTTVPVQPGEDVASIGSLVLVSDGQVVDLLLILAGADGLEPAPWRQRLTPADAAAPSPAAAVRLDGLVGGGATEDAIGERGGALAAVLSTKAGSARCRLFLKQHPDAAALFVNESAPSGIFFKPHFMRPRATRPNDGHLMVGRPPIVALSITRGDTSPVLFLPESAAAYAAPRKLPAAGDATPSDAQLLRLGSGYLLLTKTRLPFAEGDSESPERSLAHDASVPLGILHAIVLDSGYAPMGRVTKILGDTPIYQMDADVHADKVVILATTTMGAVLVNGPLKDGTISAGARVDIAWGHPLASPTVLAVGEQVHVALLESPGTAAAHVITTTLPSP